MLDAKGTCRKRKSTMLVDAVTCMFGRGGRFFHERRVASNRPRAFAKAREPGLAAVVTRAPVRRRAVLHPAGASRCNRWALFTGRFS